MTARIETHLVLRSLGFVQDPALVSDPPGGLAYDFGEFKLFASFIVNRSFRPVVMLSAVVTAARTLVHVECEIPQDFESREQGIAWVTWCLDKHSNGLFVPTRPVPWVTEGRAHRHLLPWEVERQAYEARPQCYVQRDFARLVLRRLADLIRVAADHTRVVFSFDGKALSIQVGEALTTVHATGDLWSGHYSLSAGQLRALPKRLMDDPVCFSIWRDELRIGRNSYAGIEETKT